MATVSAPYGFRPLNLLGGQPAAGSTRLVKIPASYAVSIQTGDPVIITFTGATRGTLARFNGTTTATTATTTGGSSGWIGIFVGCSYTDATTGPTFRQTYVANNAATDIMGYVVDDPDALFQIQADGVVDQTMVNCNFGVIQTVAGAATNVPSGVALDASTFETTATLPVRLVGFVDAPGSAIGDAFTDCIVRINTHAHRTAAGTDNS